MAILRCREIETLTHGYTVNICYSQYSVLFSQAQSPFFEEFGSLPHDYLLIITYLGSKTIIPQFASAVDKAWTGVAQTKGKDYLFFEKSKETNKRPDRFVVFQPIIFIINNNHTLKRFISKLVFVPTGCILSLRNGSFVRTSKFWCN